MKYSTLLQLVTIPTLLLLLCNSKSNAQSFQVGISAGGASLYMHEDYYSDFSYYNEIVFQTDFAFLDSSQLPKFGFSLYSNAADSWVKLNGQEFYQGVVSNTGVVISRYFSKQLFERLSGNLQLGTGLNLETTYNGRTQMMLNINFGAELKYRVGKHWFIQAKGIAVAQDLPNIIRYYAYDVAQEAGEDVHLLYLIGAAVNLGK